MCEPKKETNLTRRDVLLLAGTGLVGAALAPLGLQAAEGADPKTNKLSIGKPQDYPAGTVKMFPEQKFAVLADAMGVYALSLVCTHKGGPLDYKAGEGFICQWHGAVFDQAGKVLKAPAREPLPWYEVSLDKEQLWVDLNKTVPAGTHWSLPV